MDLLLFVVGLAAVAVSDVVLALPNFVVVYKYDVVLHSLRDFTSPIAYVVGLDIFALPLALAAKSEQNADAGVAVAFFMARADVLMVGGAVALSLLNVLSLTPLQAAANAAGRTLIAVSISD